MFGFIGASLPGTAGAYCRATTCDAADPDAHCATDAHGCSTTGFPLYWAGGCLSYGVQETGSPRRHIDYPTFSDTVRIAFSQWLGAKCEDGGHPAFRMWDLDDAYGPVVCDVPEYNHFAPNANVWMFRDGDWPYASAKATLALTTLTFDPASGRILDADVEVNSFARDVTTSATDVGDDLQSILTHEAGHFLGLSHSDVSGATMSATYSAGDLTTRSLAEDDQKAICALFPFDGKGPSCSEPEPTHGYSRYCNHDPPPEGGCSVLPSRTAAGGAERLVAIGAGLALLIARRSRPQGRPPGQ